MQSVTFPADTFTPDMLKALSVTGRIVTIDHKFQAKVITVEGSDWTTIQSDSGEVVLDHHCTPLGYLYTPTVYYSYTHQDEWTGRFVQRTGWTPLSQVSKGVCLVKG